MQGGAVHQMGMVRQMYSMIHSGLLSDPAEVRTQQVQFGACITYSPTDAVKLMRTVPVARSKHDVRRGRPSLCQSSSAPCTHLRNPSTANKLHQHIRGQVTCQSM